MAVLCLILNINVACHFNKWNVMSSGLVWVFSRYCSFLPHSNIMHVRFIHSLIYSIVPLSSFGSPLSWSLSLLTLGRRRETPGINWYLTERHVCRSCDCWFYFVRVQFARYSQTVFIDANSFSCHHPILKMFKMSLRQESRLCPSSHSK